MTPLLVIVLAAGQGTRMRSGLPKVLHKIAHRSLLEMAVSAAQALQPEEIVVVYGHGGTQVREALAHLEVTWVEQTERLGTGHAVQQAREHIRDDANVLVTYGDVPLIEPSTLCAAVERASPAAMSIITVEPRDPSGYGRIVRDSQSRVIGIVEHKDATEQQRRITEINTGIMVLPGKPLKSWLSQIQADNAQGEYYLTDVVEIAVNEGWTVETVQPTSEHEVAGVNDRVQLAELERHYQLSQAKKLMLAGATLRDPARVDVRGDVTVGCDVSIDVNVILEGDVRLAEGVHVGANTLIRNSTIAENTQVLPNCVIDGSVVGRDCRIGPFARLRPETRLQDHVHIGNFVEIKKSRIANGSKVNHLSYVGDSVVGERVNIGAGTITCNYDGANKHETIIGDGAFIGSGTQLVAPVEIGESATIGAGSTITKNTEPGVLTLSRARQTSIKNWRKPQKST